LRIRDSMTDELKKFGRYFLLDRLAKGGMAEIFRARLAQADGGSRIVVIKRIERSFDASSVFLNMFRDEIRVTMGLTHPNICTLHDFGEENGQPYIIMEWVDGKDLRQHLTRLDELNRPLPPELAALIIAEAATGLHYAHTFTDKSTGEALNIVHRDISPRNILISYLGIVKIIDFGIAKATSNLDTTVSGTIKGKPSYLSPEQLSGVRADGRCDVFALGSVLWELLTARKLFQGGDDVATIKQIENCEMHIIPPSVIRPHLPKALDEIVLKALKKKPDDRYSNAEEFQIALTRFAHERHPGITVRDIARFTNEVFAPEIEKDRETLKRLNRTAEEMIRAEVKPAPPEIEVPPPTPSVAPAPQIDLVPNSSIPRSAGSAPRPLGSSPRPANTLRHTNSRIASAPAVRPQTRKAPPAPKKKQRSFGTFLIGSGMIIALAFYANQWFQFLPKELLPQELHLKELWQSLAGQRPAAVLLQQPVTAAVPTAVAPVPTPVAIPSPAAAIPAKAVPLAVSPKTDPFADTSEDEPPKAALGRTSPPESTGFPVRPQPASAKQKPKQHSAPAPITAVAVRTKAPSAAARHNPPPPVLPLKQVKVTKPEPKPEVRPEIRFSFKMDPLANGLLASNSPQITLRFSSRNQPVSIALVDFIRYSDDVSGMQKDLTNIFQFQNDGSLTAPGSAFFSLLANTDGKKTISIQAMDQQGNALEGTVTFKLRK